MDFSNWKTLLETNDKTLINELNEAPSVEVGEFLDEIDNNLKLSFFKKLNFEKKSEVFCELKIESQNFIFENLNKKDFSSIFKNIESDTRADFYKQLTIEQQNKLIPFLNKEIKKDVLLLSSYSDDTSGSIMSTDFATIYNDMTVAQALEKLKIDSPSKKMIYYTYVVDEEMKMLGFISLHDLILADEGEHISNLVKTNFIFAYVETDKEEVASMIEKYSLVAIPILNHDRELLGIVKYDDAIEVIKNERSEDMEKMMGISSYSDNIDYLSISCLTNYNKRIWWLIGLFFLGIFTSLAINKFENILTQIPLLTPFLPMISSVGGNTGSQSSSLIIRALSLKEIDIRDCFKVLCKEFNIALLISITMFILAFAEGLIISLYNNQGIYSSFYIALTVGISLLIQIIFSTVLGALLPLIVKIIGKDPAVIATPAIMTIVDILSVLIYFTIAKKIILS